MFENLRQDPEKATYLPFPEYHNYKLGITDRLQSRYGKAIQHIITLEKYESKETIFGLTSKYWKQRRGFDHILVFSKAMYGVWHPKGKRGNFHYLHSQFQTHTHQS